ncbi:MAG: PDZ domain-containing protein [Schumannella sp.]
MADSQEEAVAAALTELGIDYTSIVTVRSTIDGYPADGVLEAGDRILTVDGDPIDGVTELSATLAARPVGSSFQVGIEREGEPMTVALTTAASEQDPARAIIGILAGADYRFPFDVDINLGTSEGRAQGPCSRWASTTS